MKTLTSLAYLAILRVGPNNIQRSKMNNQKPFPVVKDSSGTLEVHSIFSTIQGEGPFQGVPATFVRLYGCNLQCAGCDTDYTSTHMAMWPSAILDRVLALTGPARLVVISGGEPFRQKIAPLVTILHAEGFRVQIETNGTIPPVGLFPFDKATIVCSPKTPVINNVILRYATAFKYVLSADSVDETDGLPINVLGGSGDKVARPPEGFTGPVYVQPMDSWIPHVNTKNMVATVRSCLKYGYTVGIQIHKILRME